MRRNTHRRSVTGLSACAAISAGLAVFIAPQQAGAEEVRPVPQNGIWTVDGRGNGHGHGLSQYGARGAAIAGLTYDKILAFYYPGTVLTSAASTQIRVQISGVPANPTVLAETGLSVSGVAGALPTTGIDRWRLVPSGTGFRLDQHKSTGWSAYKTLTAAKVNFTDSDATVTVVRASGNSPYRGTVSGVRSGNAAIVVNTTSLDNYVRGVVPAEMPASWQAAAVQAQAVAARTYARWFVVSPRSSLYDICDTTACQVYNGVNAEHPLANDAIAKTAGRVLTYNGQPVFAEFSASNGGITSSGNQPYFVTKTDPYDNEASGDPYLGWTVQVNAASLASRYGFTKLTQLKITEREGGGLWGGLVKTAVLYGTLPNGSAGTRTVGGAELAGAMGLRYRYFRIRDVEPIGAVESASKPTIHSVRLTGWGFDPMDTSKPAAIHTFVDTTRYDVRAGIPRPDIQAQYGTVTAAHGFSIDVPVAAGSHKICVYVIALSGKTRTLLSCRTVVVPVNPLGKVDSVTQSEAGSYRLVGWTFDPDRDGGAGRVQITVDGIGFTSDALLSRPEIRTKYGLTNDIVGFDVTVSVPTGSHKICSYGLNLVGAGATVLLSCLTVTA